MNSGLKPKIRFKDFTDDWNECKIENLLELLTDYDANGSFSDMANNVNVIDGQGYAWYVRMTDLENYNKLENLKFVDKSSYDFMKKTHLYGGELLMAKRGDIGKVYIFKARTKYATVAPNMYLLKLNSQIYPYFLYDFFCSNIGKKKLIQNNASTTMGALYKNDVKNIELKVPKIIEQKKIGKLLDKVDNYISLIQRKCDKLIELKKSLLEKMFPQNNSVIPEIRFKGFTDDWEQRKLGNIGYTFTGLSGKTKDDFGHGQARFVTYMNVFSNPIATIEKTELVEIDQKQNEVQYGDIFFTTSSETPEEVGMSSVWLENTANIYLNSFCFGFRPIEDNNPYYMAYMLRAKDFRSKMILLAQGISRYNISKNSAMDIEIQLPKSKEQELIGKLFYKIDNLITLHQRKHDKLNKIKQSLLNDMFV